MPSAADESLDYDLLIVQVCEFLDNGDGIHRFHGPSQALAELPAGGARDALAQTARFMADRKL